uniref:Uncharacterized protein n=1 Tax=Romanomermis culicivorax TaxID=13658 RepID=A0A915L0Q4_ROMCU
MIKSTVSKKLHALQFIELNFVHKTTIFTTFGDFESGRTGCAEAFRRLQTVWFEQRTENFCTKKKKTMHRSMNSKIKRRKLKKIKK